MLLYAVMKTFRLLLCALACSGAMLIASAPKAHAEQGYANIELVTSKTRLTIGEEVSVAVYINGQGATPFGKANISIEAWHAGDLNPKGYEFVRFDASGSNFPIAGAQGVSTGLYNHQCRYFQRSASANMTGRQLFGKFIFRAVNTGSYGFSLAAPCNSSVGMLPDEDNIVLDSNRADITITKPSAPTTPNTGTTTQKQSASNKTTVAKNDTATGQSATAESSKPEVESSQTENNNTATSDSDDSKTSTSGKTEMTSAAAKKSSGKVWIIWAILGLGAVGIAAWRVLLRRKKSK